MVYQCPPPFWHPAFSEGFILDWDGVLADTKLSFTAIRKKYFDGKVVPLFEAIHTLPPPIGAFLEKDIYDVEMAGAEKAKAVPGARDLIEWLEGKGISWCIVSRNCMDSISLAAERAGLPLPPLVRSRDIPPVKPDPEALWAAASSLGVPIWKCVVVGDFVYDLVGARRAGMRAVLVQRPCAEWKHWADVSFDHLTDFVMSLKAPEPFIPWEYASLAEEKGFPGLASLAETGVSLTADDPFLLSTCMTLASKGVLFFHLDDDARPLSPEQWRNLPGLAPSWLDQPVKKVVEVLLGMRFPLARTDGGENTLFLPPGPELEALIGGEKN